MHAVIPLVCMGRVEDWKGILCGDVVVVAKPLPNGYIVHMFSDGVGSTTL